MANTYDTNLILQSIASAITNAATSDPNLLAKLQAIADAITNGGGGGSVTASNVSVVPTSPFVSTNLQNLSVEEANAIASNAGDITTINTALGNTSISGIGDGSVTGAIATNNSNINTINTALGNTSISGIGDGSVTGAISTLNSSISNLDPTNFTLLATVTTSSTSGTIANLDAYKYMYFVLSVNNNRKSMLLTRSAAVGVTVVNELYAPRAAGQVTQANMFSDLATYIGMSISSNGTYTASIAYCNANFIGELQVYGIK